MVNEANDPDVHVPTWIKEEAVPLGIEREIKPGGVFPPSTPSRKPWFPIAELDPSMTNYSSFAEHEHKAMAELDREIKAGYLRTGTIDELERLVGKLFPS